MDAVLGIDLGTSYFKAGVFDPEGDMLGLGRVAVPKDTGDGTLCEVPCERFWSLLAQVVAAACHDADLQPSELCALSYSSQANSFLLLDGNDRPLTPLVLWPDTRAASREDDLQPLFDRADTMEITGLGIGNSPLYAALKAGWFRRTQPALWKRAARLMTISDYFAFALTGERVGDMGTASLLATLDLQNERWWPDALEAYGLTDEMLSTPIYPGSEAGATHRKGADLLGVPAGIPFALGSLDHHVAAIGAGVGHVADMSESTGTVVACVHLADDYTPRAGCCLGPGMYGQGHYMLTFTENGGEGLEWYQREYADGLSLRALDDLANMVPPGSEGLMARPQAHVHDGLSGFIGATDSHGQGHYFRALMESTAASLAQLVDDLCGTERPARIVATGGGAKSIPWLQMKADLIGTVFVTPRCDEPACLGAAMLAAIAAGWYDELSHIEADWAKLESKVSPDPEGQRVYEEWLPRYREATEQTDE